MVSIHILKMAEFFSELRNKKYTKFDDLKSYEYAHHKHEFQSYINEWKRLKLIEIYNNNLIKLTIPGEILAFLLDDIFRDDLNGLEKD